MSDLGNLDTFDFNEKTGEYSFNRNRLISNLSEENPAHVKTINDFYLKATGAKTIEELDLDNPESSWFWCSAFIHDLLIKVGAKPLETYDSYDRARAKKYANYGKKVNSLSEAESGDILLIGDPETGEIKHLTLLISDDLEKFFMPTYPEPLGRNRDYVLGLGGNQQGSSYGPSANEVNVKPFDVDEVLGIRRIDEITPEMKKRLMNDNPNYKVFLQGAVEFSEQPLSRPKEFNKGGRVAYQEGTDLVDFYTGGKYDTDDVVSKRKEYETPVTDAIKSVNEKTGVNLELEIILASEI